MLKKRLEIPHEFNSLKDWSDTPPNALDWPASEIKKTPEAFKNRQTSPPQ